MWSPHSSREKSMMKDRVRDGLAAVVAAAVWGMFVAWLLIPVTILDKLLGR